MRLHMDLVLVEKLKKRNRAEVEKWSDRPRD